MTYNKTLLCTKNTDVALIIDVAVVKIQELYFGIICLKCPSIQSAISE